MPATPTISPRARWQGGTAHPSRHRILLVLCLSLLVVVIDNTVLNTALPTLARELHAGTASLQWVTDSYSLVFAAVLISAGALGDRYGRRLALMAGLALFGVGSVGAALSSGTGVLIGWRAVMGLGAAFVMPATLSILNSVFPAKERAQAIAAWSAVAGVGVVIGPTLGGALLAHFAWGSIFWVNVPLVALALVVVLAIVPEIEVGTHRAPLDIIGVASSGLGLLGLVDAVIQAPEQGWTAPRTLGELGLAVVALVGFVVWERRSPAPMLDVRVFANRAFSAASGSIAVVFFALFGSLFALTQYLQLVHGYSTLAAGVRALPWPFAFVGLIGGRWALMLLAELAAGGRRYQDLHDGLEGVSHKVLTETLRRAERDGLIRRQLDPGRTGTATLYQLTGLGRSLEEPLAALGRWVEANWDQVEAAQRIWDARADS
jgi:EmrB/QacA subfamily drug resistance transporter